LTISILSRFLNLALRSAGPNNNEYAVSNAQKKAPKANETKYVGFQSWTDSNLCVESSHNDILYYTTRWDALCPYVDVPDEMLRNAPKPLIVYALPPEGPYGVPIGDRYGLVDTQSEAFWNDERRQRKFKEYDKLCRNFIVTEDVVRGSDLTFDMMIEMGGDHFANCYIDDREVEGFLDYVRNLEVLIIRVQDQDGTLILTDVSILLPEYNQLYGSFCQWNRDYKNRSPGIYACLLAVRWARDNGLRYYNLGPVDDYGYKALFVTDYEPIYSLALTDLDHPLALDETSPLHTDFGMQHWNKVYRDLEPARKFGRAV
jgi:arginyl-tRNA--protein-N-Asp/Glu arginylyltransferase